MDRQGGLAGWIGRVDRQGGSARRGAQRLHEHPGPGVGVALASSRHVWRARHVEHQGVHGVGVVVQPARGVDRSEAEQSRAQRTVRVPS